MTSSPPMRTPSDTALDKSRVAEFASTCLNPVAGKSSGKRRLAASSIGTTLNLASRPLEPHLQVRIHVALRLVAFRLWRMQKAIHLELHGRRTFASDLQDPLSQGPWLQPLQGALRLPLCAAALCGQVEVELRPPQDALLLYYVYHIILYFVIFYSIVLCYILSY